MRPVTAITARCTVHCSCTAELAQAAYSLMSLIEDPRADAARRGVDIDEPLALAVRNARYLRGFLVDTRDWIDALAWLMRASRHVYA